MFGLHALFAGLLQAGQTFLSFAICFNYCKQSKRTEIGRTPLELDALLLLALPLLLTLQALVADLTLRSHQLARTRFAHRRLWFRHFSVFIIQFAPFHTI